MGDRPETAHLRPVLAAIPDLVDDALRSLFPGPDPTVNLGGIRTAVEQLDGALDASEMVMRLLERHGKVDGFVGFLRARGVDLAPSEQAAVWDAVTDLPGFDPDPEMLDSDFPDDELAKFLPRAKAFRCQILLHDKTVADKPFNAGSGAFVTDRLVMTAGHVIAPLTAARAARAAGMEVPVPAVMVRTSDGEIYPAQYAWHRPEYPGEHKGELPPPDQREKFCDVALLRVAAPVGVSFGHIDLARRSRGWNGRMRMALVHYPDGARTGFCAGWALRKDPSDIRLPHSIPTEHGSSGGVAFDRQMLFLGLHQGRRKGHGSLVPNDLYADDAEFRACIEADRPPAYIWSLDGTLSGRLVIGRKAFFSAVAAMLEAPQGQLRGIWVKRDDTADPTGLGFSLDMLRAFLDRNQPAAARLRHRCVPVASSLGTGDLIEAVRVACALDPVAGPAEAGDLLDLLAGDADRARDLAHRLATMASTRDECLWICFENPTAGLTHDVQIQLEHLMREILLHPSLRLIMTGFETVDHSWLRVFARPDEAQSSPVPGVVVDYVGRFSLADVEITARQMFSDLGIDASPNRVRAALDFATTEAKTMAPGIFRPDQLRKVAELLRTYAGALDGKP